MKIALYLLGVIAGLFGMAVLLASGSAFQETVAFLIILIGAVFFVGGAVVGAINAVGRKS